MQPTKCLSYLLCLAAVLVSVGPAQTNRPSQGPQLRRVELQRALASFSSWAKRHATKTGAVSGSRALEEGIALAKGRRAAMVELMKSDPDLALAASTPGSLRNSLPSAINDELEVPISGMGDLLVLCAISPQGAPATDTIQRRVRLNGQTYRAYVFGRRLNETTKYSIPLHGVALDGVLALDDKVLSEVAPEEASSSAEPIVDLTSAAGSKPDAPKLARMGEKIYRFASADHLKRSEELLEAAESGLRPEPIEAAPALLERGRLPQAEQKPSARPLVAAPGTGPQTNRVLVIRTDFIDLPGDPRSLIGAAPYSASSVQTVADTQVASYYHNSSYGNAVVAFAVTPNVYRLPRTAAQYSTSLFEFQLYYDAIAAAKADYNLADYEEVVVLFSWLGSLPGSQIQFGGLSLIGTSMVWVNGEFDFRVLAHELGHSYGLYHANFWKTNDGDPISDNGSSIEYWDPFDVMGANWGNDARADFNPWFKHQLSWIHDEQVQTVTESGTYRVYRFDDARATGTLALKVTKDPARDYWIGLRRNFTQNSALSHGAYVIWGYHEPRQSSLLGLGAVVNSPRDAALILDTPLADPAANVTIVPVGEGGTEPNEYLDVQITFGPPPLITAQPAAQMVLEGEGAQFIISATGSPHPFFIWQRKASGTGDWLTLSDGAEYSGSSTASLALNATTAAMDGDAFRCLLTNSAGGFNCSRPALLTVNRFGVATFAGQPGMQGWVDGMGRLAQFSSPTGVAIDQMGNVYVADTGNHVIRKITPNGTVTTWAGLAGAAGNSDGIGDKARFNSPVAVVADAEGNVFVADQGNSAIRKITSDGSVTTVVLSAVNTGNTSAVAPSARLNRPSGLAADCFGNLYVTDTGNQTVRMIDAQGVVSTLAGLSGSAGATDGIGSAARFDGPGGIALDAEGNVFVADQNNSTIRKITPAGVVTTFAGMAGQMGNTDGARANARFSFPAGLAMDLAGNLYVADRNNSTIREITPGGQVTTLAGTSGSDGAIDGARDSARFSFPIGVTVDTQGAVYVADSFANTIRLIRSAPPQLPVLSMSALAGQLILSWPAAATGFVLETCSALSAEASWVPVTTEPVVIGCSIMVTNDMKGTTGFFRLNKK